MTHYKNACVSVIIPVYNIGQYLEQCLGAVSRQTYKSFKVILIDDGSTDISSKICDAYAEKNTNVIVVHQKNQGVSTARNKGIELVDTEYFTFIDGDDVPYQDYLETLVDLIDNNKSDLVAASIKLAMDPNARTDVEPLLTNSLSSEEAMIDLLYNRSIGNGPVAKLYRTSTFKNVQFKQDLAVGEDMEYVFRCLRLSQSVVVTNSVVYNYMQRQGSAMRQEFSSKRADSYRAAMNIYGSIAEVDAKLKRAAEAKLFEEAFAVALEARQKQKEFRGVYTECCRTAKERARGVFLSSEARVRQRIYAGLAVINIKLAFLIADIKKKLIG